MDGDTRFEANVKMVYVYFLFALVAEKTKTLTSL